MFVRTMETLAGGEWTGADTWVDVFDPVDVRQPVVRVPALTAAQVTGVYDAETVVGRGHQGSVLGDVATAVRQGAKVELGGDAPAGGLAHGCRR